MSCSRAQALLTLLPQRAAHCLQYQAFKPSPTLPDNCDPIILEYPYLAYKGIGLSTQELSDYADKLGLYDGVELGKDSLKVLVQAKRRLSKEVDYKLKLRLSLSPDYEIVLGIYSNIDVWNGTHDRLDPDDEDDLLSEIQQLLGVNSPPMWHYDRREHYVRRKPWKQLSEDEIKEGKRIAAAVRAENVARRAARAARGQATAAAEVAMSELKV